MLIDKNLLLGQNKKLNKNIKILAIITQQYYKENIFNIVLIANHNLVKKIPQLKKHNCILIKNKKRLDLIAVII